MNKIGKLLIGDESERAVSPVIGVILMVAITVILAAVIAAFVLDMGGSVSQEAQAGVDLEVDETSQTVEMSVTSMGNADQIILRSDIPGDESAPTASQSGDVITLDYTDQDGINGGTAPDDFTAGASGDEGDPKAHADSNTDAVFNGTVTAVAIIDGDDTETTVTSEDFDFYDDFIEMSPAH